MDKTKSMDEKKEACQKGFQAIRDALDVFRGKWAIQIVGVLIHYEKLGFQDLTRNVEGISPKMLSKELKELEINLLITRNILDTRPVTVEYAITEYGKKCAPVIAALHEWGENHRKEVINSINNKVAI